MATTIHSDPVEVDITRNEILPLQWDFSNVLSMGETIGSATAKVMVENDRLKREIEDVVPISPTINGSIVRANVEGFLLFPGTSYVIEIVANISATKHLASLTILNCIA